jgi:hypothetical protein
MEFYPYYYYSKIDSKKEPIDRIIAISYESALQHFCDRKQMDSFTFEKLFTLIQDNETKSKQLR